MSNQINFDDFLVYDKDSGLLTWKVSVNSKFKPGDIAGSPTSNGRYLRIGLFGRQFLSHVVAYFLMTGEMPTLTIDHIDGNGINNKWENLRHVTVKENMRNQRRRSDNISGLMGVDFHASLKKWRARICVDSKEVSLGVYADLFDAACARKSAENKYRFHQNHGRIST